MQEANAKQITMQLEHCVTARAPYEQIMRECFDHCYPLRGEGLQSSSTYNADRTALDRKAFLVDSTATDGVRINAASLQLGMTPASARWMEFAVHGASDRDKRWLDSAADVLHQEIHNSNFDSESPDCMLDVVASGQGILFIDENTKAGGGFLFQCWAVGQCFYTSTRADGQVDTIYRKFRLTAAQVLDFARERGGSASTATQAKAATHPGEWIDMCYAIYPRPMHVVGSAVGRNMPFAAVMLELSAQHIVSESGFHEFPCVVPRWQRIPGAHYAVGPMFEALPDARLLNTMKRMDLAAADLAIGGAWKGVDDGVLNPRTVEIKPRRVVPVASMDSLDILTAGNNWQLADARIAQLQMAIRKILLADQLQPQDGPAMTATEIHARIALIRQQLGPTFGRMQAEYLQALVLRCFMIAMRAGLFGEVPQSLAGANFAIRYISPLARAQRLEDVTAIQAQVVDVLQMVGIDESIVDNYDWDEIQRILSEARGVPAKAMRDVAQVVEIRDARAKAQEQQRQQALQEQLAAEMAGQRAGAANAA